MLTVEELAERDVDVLVCANTKAIRPRSAGRTIEIFHGMSFRNMAVREDNAGKDAYFLLGPYMRRAFAERGLLPDGDPRGVEVGFPKTDRLLDGTLDRAAILAAEGLSGERPGRGLRADRGQAQLAGDDGRGAASRTSRRATVTTCWSSPTTTRKNRIDWCARLAPLEDEHLRVARDARRDPAACSSPTC